MADAKHAAHNLPPPEEDDDVKMPPPMPKDVKAAKQVLWVLGEGPTANIWQFYEKKRQLGVPGAYGSCFVATEAKSGTDWVVKTIQKRGRDKVEIEAFRKEVETMKSMVHPNIIGFHEAYESQDELHIVMELCTGGDLFDEIEYLQRTKEIPSYSEQDCARILKQVLLAVKYMHEHHVIHCDLKPDNLVYTSHSHTSLKLIDFGMARFWNARERQVFSQTAGTPYYAAPEVVKRHYSIACDMWSIGVIIYIMLIGYPPFYASADQYKKYYSNKMQAQQMANEAIRRKVLDGFQPVVKRGTGPWFPSDRPISAQAMDLIARLLETDTARRLTAKEALAHPWIAGEASQAPLHPEVIRSIRQFDAKLKLQQHALNLMVDLLTDDEHKALARTFANMDKNGDGLITISEFRDAMVNPSNKWAQQEDLSEDRIQQMFNCTDLDGDGFICYHELVLASVHCKLVAREERLRNAFAKFDVNGDGKISAEELMKVLAIEESQAQAMIRQIKKDDKSGGHGDMTVDYEEFLDMWRDNVQRQLSTI